MFCQRISETLPIMSRNILGWTLNILFVVQWTYLAFGVHNREAWILENILLALFMGPTVWAYYKGYLSRTSYVLLFVFVSLHNIGAHYTYSLVPYEKISQSLGFSIDQIFGFERNQYDRMVHFLWGLLLYLPLREGLHRWTYLRGALLSVFALFTLIVASSVYEMMEWGAAVIFGDGASMNFVGIQGDVWDAHKDQALAMLGTLIAIPLFFKKKLPGKRAD